MASGIVYVIDDDPGLLHSTGFVLQSLGFDFEVFAGAEEFLGALHALKAGCILTDLRMPAMDGFELQSAVARSVDWPIILMTSDNGAVNAQSAAKRGFSGFLRKPFSPDELSNVLEACFAGRGESSD